jgi:ATP-dependent DNA helicase RecG
MELSELKGVGPKTLEYLNKLGIYDVNDLIRYYPYRYNVYHPINLNDVNTDESVVITGIIISQPNIFYIKKGLNRLSFKLETNNREVKVTIFNRMFIKQHLSIGKKITLIGKYDKLKNSFVASDIKLYAIHGTEVEPVYHMVQGLKRKSLKTLIDNATAYTNVPDILPNYLNIRYNLLNTKESIIEIHNPTGIDKLKQAKLKLKYDELFEFMFKINLLKFKSRVFNDYYVKNIDDGVLNNIIHNLPFKLTDDQLSSINDIMSDFKSEKRMNRLILGDVGSGKTIISFIACLLNCSCGYQSAILAPTEVLANQHYENFIKLFPDINVKLLTGSTSAQEKKLIIDELSTGKIDILIGTHAIISDNIEFMNIGLVVTDEQHRFGVNQRKALQNKGMNVDVLYMSATPIPRTYALTIYGDMDISMIKAKPSGRKDIITKLYGMKHIKDVCGIITQEINNKHQVYVVAPLIDDEEDREELQDLKKIKELLTSNLSIKPNIEILHGKMRQVDKDKVMNKFKAGDIDILISTTVIEVGVDVKNSTIMTIFNAERFGLATLHQLRGRVGRNDLQSYCLLVSDKETDRLNVMCESNDGFYIAEKDFKLRGSGDLFGTKQHGDMVFKIADLHTDMKILLQCKKDSEEFINNNIDEGFRNYEYYKDIQNKLLNNN